jgi:hypothetical protein
VIRPAASRFGREKLSGRPHVLWLGDQAEAHLAGTKSYLLRWFFANYVSEHDEGATVGVTDDFICQESSGWSGLGAIDILAGARSTSRRKTARRCGPGMSGTRRFTGCRPGRIAGRKPAPQVCPAEKPCGAGLVPQNNQKKL